MLLLWEQPTSGRRGSLARAADLSLLDFPPSEALPRAAAAHRFCKKAR